MNNVMRHVNSVLFVWMQTRRSRQRQRDNVTLSIARARISDTRIARFLRASLLVMSGTIGLFNCPFSFSQNIILVPVDDEPTPAGFTVDPDFKQLFRSPAHWDNALKKTDTIEFVRRYIETERDDDLRSMFSFLNERHIALSVVFGVVPASNCGNGVEGTAHRADENISVAKKIRALGGNLSIIGLDEPLHFGHYFQGKNGCRYSIPELAKNASNEISQIKSIFPHASVIDIEPSSGLGTTGELKTWLTTLHRSIDESTPLSLRFDVQWAKDWKATVPPILSVVTESHLTYGLYVNGSFSDNSDAEWIASAKSHILEWTRTLHTAPDHLAFGGWNPHPSHVLPESDPSTLPALINWYCSATPASKCLGSSS